MIVEDLKKGDFFKVVGWDESLVLKVLIPLEGLKGIKLCQVYGDSAVITGHGVLCGRVKDPKDLYVLSILAKVVIVKKRK